MNTASRGDAADSTGSERLDQLRRRVAELEELSAKQAERLAEMECRIPRRLASGFVELVGDITARRLTERHLRQQRDLAIALSSTVDLPTALNHIIDTALAVEGVDCGGIYLADPRTGALRLESSRNLSPAFVKKVEYYSAASANTRLVSTGNCSFWNSDEVRQNDPTLLEEGITAVAIVPILHKKRLIACFNVASHRHDELPAATRTILEELAAELGSTLVRIRVEEALRASEARLRLVLSSLKDLVFVLDASGHFQEQYPPESEDFYRPPGEFLGKHYRDCLPPALADQTAAAIAALNNGEELWSYEYTLSIDGQPQWYHANASRIEGRSEHAPAYLFAIRNITERKQAEEENKRQTALTNSLLDSIPDLIFFKNVAGAYLGCNPPFAEFAGRPREEIIGKTDYDLFDKESADFFREHDRRMLAERRPRHNEEWITYPDRRRVLVDTLKTPYWGPDGNLIGILGISRDITERWCAEEALQAKTEELDRYFTSSLDLLCIANTSGHFVRLNPEWEKTLGYALSELEGQSFLDFVHPDDMESTLAAVARLRGQEQVLNFENRYLCKDGSYRWIEWRSLPQGGLIYATARDVTDRRVAEQELRKFKAIADASPHGYCIIDADGTALYANEAWSSMHGYTPAELRGLPVSRFHTSRQMHRVNRLLESLRRKGHFTAQEVGHRRKDGSTFPTQMDAVLIRDDHGRPAFLAGMAVDITDRKRTEREKAALEEGLRQTQKLEAIGTLASGIAHDFNNLLTAIFGYTDLAKTTLPANHAALGSLEMVEQSARQARGVTNALLTFSRRQVAEKAVVDLCEVARGSIRLIRRLLPGSIEISASVPSSESIWVNADVTQMQQVILNLAVNARDAMPTGGRLSLTLESVLPDPHSSPAAGEATMTIRDTGCGMSRAIQARIFEPFFSTKPKGLGTGLGLTVTLNIVRDHGGRMEFQSRPRRGTSFTIRLPCCAPPSEPLRSPGPRPPASSCRGLVLLVVPDDHVRSIMTSCIRALGCDVLPLAETAGLLDAFRAHAAATRLAVVDIDAEKPNSIRSLLEAEPGLGDLPLVLTCGTAQQAPVAFPTDRLHLLHKPFQMSQLTNLIAHLLAPPPVGAPNSP